MAKLLQINITANWGSHGKIAEGIGNIAISHGWDSYIAYGRWFNPSKSHLFHIGSMLDERIHGVMSRLFDIHGLMSKYATKQLITYIEKINPDIIHLHNIHGYYLNYPILFKFLAKTNKPIVWTLHDCWAFTGHCAHYMYIGCDKWKCHCYKCPQIHAYPKSVLFDNSKKNFDLKKKFFLMPQHLVLVPVSKWLENDVEQSFLNKHKIAQIYNGIDTQAFAPSTTCDVFTKYKIQQGKRIILGVASNWYRKGLNDFFQLSELIDNQYIIFLVGLNQKDIDSLPKNIIGIRRTQNVQELVELYSAATVFFNPTWEDNFPTTNIESLACGTPVITYNTGGSPEAIEKGTGYVIEKGDVKSGLENIIEITKNGKAYYTDMCRNSVLKRFNKDERYNEYFDLYCKMLNK